MQASWIYTKPLATAQSWLEKTNAVGPTVKKNSQAIRTNGALLPFFDIRILQEGEKTGLTRENTCNLPELAFANANKLCDFEFLVFGGEGILM